MGAKCSSHQKQSLQATKAHPSSTTSKGSSTEAKSENSFRTINLNQLIDRNTLNIPLNTQSLMPESEIEYIIETLTTQNNVKSINFNSKITIHTIKLLSNILKTDNTIENITFTDNDISPEEEKTLLNAIAENPYSALKKLECPNNLALERRAQNILSRASKIEKITRFISTEPNNAQYFLFRANCYYREGLAQTAENIKFEMWQKAISDWKTVKKLQPDLLIASSIYRLNKTKTEIAQYVLKKERENAQHRDREEKENVRRKQEEEKIQQERIHREAVDRLQQADTLFKSAIGKYHAEKFNDSIKDFDESLSLNPNNKSIFYHRGLAKAGFKQHETAIEDFNQRLVDYLQLSKEERAELFYARGLSKVALNNLVDAKKDYQSALRENEHHPHANDALRELTQLQEQQERDRQQRAWSYQSQVSSNAGPATLFNPNAAPVLTEEDRAKIDMLKQQMRNQQQHGL